MIRLLFATLVLLSMHAYSEVTTDKKPISDKDKKSKQQEQKTQLDTSALERAIRESIKEASERHDPNADEKAKTERELVEYTRQLASETQRLSDFTLWLVVLTAAVGSIAFFQLLMFLRQLRLMQEGTTDAKNLALASTSQADTLKVGQRAWMSWVDVIHNKQTNAVESTGKLLGDGSAFRVVWENAGRTPAIRSFLQLQARVVAIDAPTPTFTPLADPPQQVPLIPGVRRDTIEWFVSKKDMDELIARRSRIFIYSRADYETVFPQEGSKYTEACLRVVFAGSAIAPNGRTEERFRYTPIGPQNRAV